MLTIFLIILLIFGDPFHFQFQFVDADSNTSTQNPCFFAWGKNDQLQLDPSILEDISQPTPIGHGVLHKRNITHISAGVTHSVIVDSEGNAYCFGSNTQGECGQGVTGGNILYPKKITSGLSFNNKKIISSSLGMGRTYLSDSDGQIYHVGVNKLIEVSSPSYNSPMGIPFSHPVASISAGTDFVLLLTEQGEIFGFGKNSHHQLGSGQRHPTSVVKLPVAVDTSGVLHGKMISQISAGGAHSLVLSSDGEVFGFGRNVFGELGVGYTSPSVHVAVPVDTSGVLFGKNMSQISAGGYHSLILSSGGEVFAFGSNEHGQLGIGSVSYAVTHAVAVNMTGAPTQACYSPLRVKFLGLGEDEDQGQRGDNTLQETTATLRDIFNTPVAVSKGFVFRNLNISHVSSTTHILFRDSNGNLIASGENAGGQLGDGSLLSPRAASSVLIPEFKVFQVSTGKYHSLVLSSEGRVYSFGWNSQGQLGIGLTGKRSSISDTVPYPVAVDTSGVLNGKYIQQISTGGYYSLVLSSDGEVFGFGMNKYGELGTGRISLKEFVPVAVDTSGVLAGKIISQISSGEQHNLMLSSEGEVFGFGGNQFGELGSGSVSRYVPFPVAVNTSGILNGKIITQISAGSLHSLVLSSNGEVYGFGGHTQGQLGVGITPQNSFPLAVPVSTSGVLSGKQIKEVSAGKHHSLVLSTDGEVFGFGANNYAQLGDGNVALSVPVPVAVNISRIDNGSGMLSSGRIFTGLDDSFVSYCYSRQCFGVDHLHPLVCSHHGECVGDDVCSCHSGYTGDECDNAVCNGIPSSDTVKVCSGHGNCTSVDHCECDTDYEGRDCENFRCFGVLKSSSFVCQGHGTCVAPDACSCHGDYEGDICIVWKNCFGIASSDTSRVCSGRGECVAINTCECAWPWGGIECESLRSVVWFIIVVSGIGALVVVSLFGGTFLSIIVTIIGLCKRVKRVEKEKRLTEHLLQGFVPDTEMDTVDADSQRARLIVQKSMLEIDFSELSELQKIGSGGSGAILFRAKWNDSVVAVKVFKSGLMSGDTFFDEFEHEVSLMSTLRHRNVINFYGCSLAYPRIAIVMELCEAGSVETLIENGVMKRKSSHEILQMLLDIAEGMSFLHSREVIHRDLKCANVLVDEHGVCKLTDFGLSKYTKDQVEKAHTVGIGTSYYVPPELANGNGEYDSSVDVYAFGILAMEMCLCRMCPFPEVKDNKHTNDVQRRALQDPSYRPDISTLDQQYSFLQWVLQQCWQEKRTPNPVHHSETL